MIEAIITGIVSGIVSGIITGTVLNFFKEWYIIRRKYKRMYKCPNPECKEYGLYDGDGGTLCCFCGQPADMFITKISKRDMVGE